MIFILGVVYVLVFFFFFFYGGWGGWGWEGGGTLTFTIYDSNLLESIKILYNSTIWLLISSTSLVAIYSLDIFWVLRH